MACGYSHGSDSTDLINKHISNSPRSQKIRAKVAHRPEAYESLTVQWIFFSSQTLHKNVNVPFLHILKISVETKSAFSRLIGDSGTFITQPSCSSVLKRFDGTSQFQTSGYFLAFKAGKQKEKFKLATKLEALLKCKSEFLRQCYCPHSVYAMFLFLAI